jgi:hypothetical protein
MHVGWVNLAKRRQVAIQRWHSVRPSVEHLQILTDRAARRL